MKQDKLIIEHKESDIYIINELTRKGYIIISCNYDYQIDRTVYHLRRTLFSFIFSRITKSLN